MELMTRLAFFQPLDFAALAILVVGWFAIGWRVEHPSAAAPSMSLIMADYRREWMRQMVARDPRIFDAQVLGAMRQGTAFFASTSVIAIGGALALIGNSDRLAGVARDMAFVDQPASLLELKLLVVLLCLTNSFLKFAWSNRLFGYCGVLMGAVPNDPADPVAMPRAMQAADIQITAARSFNRGLRSIYFSLSAIAWLAGPIPLILATAVTLSVIWRREFASRSRKILLAT